MVHFSFLDSIYNIYLKSRGANHEEPYSASVMHDEQDSTAVDKKDPDPEYEIVAGQIAA